MAAAWPSLPQPQPTNGCPEASQSIPLVKWQGNGRVCRISLIAKAWTRVCYPPPPPTSHRAASVRRYPLTHDRKRHRSGTGQNRRSVDAGRDRRGEQKVRRLPTTRRIGEFRRDRGAPENGRSRQIARNRQPEPAVGPSFLTRVAGILVSNSPPHGDLRASQGHSRHPIP